MNKEDEHKLNFLIVNDEKMIQMMIETTLLKGCKVNKYNISFTNNGLEAYNMTNDTVYGIIFMDLNMAQMNGFEACQLIKSGELMKACDNTNARLS